MVGGYQEVEVDFTADNPGLTLFHCHQQLHMDFGFMTAVRLRVNEPVEFALICLDLVRRQCNGMNTDATWANRTAKAILLIRILVGWVFLSEGIQKFLFPDSLGVGRFVKIGIPWPQVMAPFVGRSRDCVRHYAVDRFSYAARNGTAPHRYCRRLVFNQDRHVREEWVLGHAA